MGQHTEMLRLQFSKPLMGTEFKIVCYAEDSIKAKKVANIAFERIGELNNILSDYHPESEINQLCNNIVPDKFYKVSDELWYMLNRSIEVSKKTKGLFDVTAGSCIRIWRRARRRHEIPTLAAIRECKNNSGFKKVILDKNDKKVAFDTKEIRLDFGGIAKGYAADEAFKIFKDHGLKKVLIDAGGDLYCGEAPPGENGWEVVINSGLNKEMDVIYIENMAIATSGDLYQFFELDGVRYSHIINPLEGKPITKRVSTTVMAPTAEMADYLASVLNVTGIDKKAKVIMRKFPKAYVIISEEEKGEIANKKLGRNEVIIKK